MGYARKTAGDWPPPSGASDLRSAIELRGCLLIAEPRAACCSGPNTSPPPPPPPPPLRPAAAACRHAHARPAQFSAPPAFVCGCLTVLHLPFLLLLAALQAHQHALQSLPPSARPPSTHQSLRPCARQRRLQQPSGLPACGLSLPCTRHVPSLQSLMYSMRPEAGAHSGTERGRLSCPAPQVAAVTRGCQQEPTRANLRLPELHVEV